MAVNLIAAVLIPSSVSAYFTGCVANITPNSLSVGTSTNFTITVNNTGTGPLEWVDINVPSLNYAYVGHSINGWSLDEREDGVTASGGSIAAGDTQTFNVVASAGLETSDAENWTVKVAPDNGVNTFDCTGSLGTSINGHMPQDTSVGVSGVMATSITEDSTVITWQSDSPTTALVYYGKTSNYGSISSQDAEYKTSHSIELTGLSAGTKYHFQVVGATEGGAVAHSGDNTFVTATRPAPNTGSGSGGGSSTVTPGSVIIKVPGSAGDKVPPQVIISTKLAASYKTPPVISGTASDDKGIAAVEYSIDGGKNWLPVNELINGGKPSASFNFTPTLSMDGNYAIVVRAIDGAGNTTISGAQTLVIDKLPPTVGGDMMSIGAQNIKPSDQGVTRALIGSDMQITLSSVGGPTSISIDAIRDGKQKSTQSFSLTQSSATGLWSGVLNFQFAGAYQLSVRALDGAGNRTNRQLGMVIVDQPAAIRDAASGNAVAAVVTVYYRDPETQTWVLWDGSSYDQTNPITTSAERGYGAYLPGGIYYLQVKAPGYAPTITKSFTIDEPTIVSSELRLTRRPAFHFGPIHFSIPWFGHRQAVVDLTQRKKPTANAPLVNQALPNFSLRGTNGSNFSLDKLYGKPTVLIFVSTWAAPARDQLAILDQLDTKNINVLPVGAGESGSRLSSYVKVAGYDLPVVIDDANKLTSQLEIAGLPTTVFVDRHGVVKKVMVGVLSKEEIMKNVSSGL
jgi:peroxiredoxin